MDKTIGSVEMRKDGTVVLQLRAASDGSRGDVVFTYGPRDRALPALIAHVGGLIPGQSKHVPPWD